jgi:hypothetical protein
MAENTTGEIKPDRLEALKKRQSEIAAQIKALEQKDNAAKRKAETRLKVLIGAAVLSDIGKTISENAEVGEKQKKELKALLNRAIERKQDREFIKTTGWL